MSSERPQSNHAWKLFYRVWLGMRGREKTSNVKPECYTMVGVKPIYFNAMCWFISSRLPCNTNLFVTYKQNTNRYLSNSFINNKYGATHLIFLPSPQFLLHLLHHNFANWVVHKEIKCNYHTSQTREKQW